MTTRVLLVESDEHHRRAFIDAVAGSNYHVCAAIDDGDEVAPTYGKERPDLVVVSIVLAEKSGLAAIEELRARYPKTRIIATYDFRTRYLAKKAIDAGATTVLRKPFERSRVLERLGRAQDPSIERPSPDRRRAGRLAIPLLVHFRKAGTPSKKTEAGVCREISSTGARLRSSREYRSGDILLLKIDLPQRREPIETTAKVVSVDALQENGPYSLGLKFVRLSEADAKRINNLLIERTAYTAQLVPLKTAIPVLLRRTGLVPGKRRKGVCSAMGITAMDVKTNAKFPANAEVEIVFRLPNAQQPVRAIGTVKAARRVGQSDVFHHFVRYVDIDVLDQDTIREFSLAVQKEERKRPSAERRVSERIPVSLCTVECRRSGIHLAPQKNVARYLLTDLSRRGAQIVSDQYHLEGETLILKINVFGEQEPLVVTAMVRWVQESKEGENVHTMGMKFLDLSDSDKIRLDDLKKQLRKRS